MVPRLKRRSIGGGGDEGIAWFTRLLEVLLAIPFHIGRLLIQFLFAQMRRKMPVSEPGRTYFRIVLHLLVAAVIVSLVAGIWLHWPPIIAAILVSGWAGRSMLK